MVIFMRAMMGVIKDRHGTYYAQQKVPERLQQAVALVLGTGKTRQANLKKSLGTKDLKTANRVAKPVQMQFDEVLQKAEALVRDSDKPATRRTSLSDAEITKIADYVFAKGLALDERMRFGGKPEWKQLHEKARRDVEAEGRQLDPAGYNLDELKPYGSPEGWLEQERENVAADLSIMREALALGDISAVEDEVDMALVDFDISLDAASVAYRKVGTAVLQRYVQMLEAIEARNAGKPVTTPKAALAVSSPTPTGGGTLREALEGWKKERVRPEGTVSEYTRAVEMFIQLHGNLPVVDIKRSRAREFREAIQMVPRHRKGALLKAPLPELAEWGRKHPEAPKVSPGTINKQLGAVQAIVGWGHFNGLVPEDIHWSDPFHRMRVEEDEAEREPFTVEELKQLFGTPLFTEHKIPKGAGGDAGVWLPLLALFTGARQAELAGLRVSDVVLVEPDDVPVLFIVSDKKAARRLKTKVSERVIPIHPQLVAFGFLDYVASRRRDGDNAWLFPLVAPDQARRLSAWSKWFGRYLRTTAGVEDTSKVFHSFRHGFKDALRATTGDEELRDAVLGHADGKGSVSRGYGAKQMLDRWGVEPLREAVSKVVYRGLDLSRVQPPRQGSIAANARK